MIMKLPTEHKTVISIDVIWLFWWNPGKIRITDKETENSLKEKKNVEITMEKVAEEGGSM